MKYTTIFSAFEKSTTTHCGGYHVWYRRKRQRLAFRARLLEMYQHEFDMDTALGNLADSYCLNWDAAELRAKRAEAKIVMLQGENAALRNAIRGYPSQMQTMRAELAAAGAELERMQGALRSIRTWAWDAIGSTPKSRAAVGVIATTASEALGEQEPQP